MYKNEVLIFIAWTQYRRFWALNIQMEKSFSSLLTFIFGLRLAQKGVFLIRKNELLARHHTKKSETHHIKANTGKAWEKLTTLCKK